LEEGIIRMRENDNILKMAELNIGDLEQIKILEKKLGDICLIAVEKEDALYVLEAKVAPNKWAHVDMVYPEIENLKAYYGTEETAKLSKGALKSFLISNTKYKNQKRPVRIRKIK